MTSPATTNSLSGSLLSSLALDLAQNLDPIDVVATRHEISIDDITRLLDNPFFAKVLEQAITEWNAIANTEERIQVKARMAIERSLKSLFEMANLSKSGPDTALSAIQMLYKLGGMDKSKNLENGMKGQLFSITINVPPAPVPEGAPVIEGTKYVIEGEVPMGGQEVDA